MLRLLLVAGCIFSMRKAVLPLVVALPPPPLSTFLHLHLSCLPLRKLVFPLPGSFRGVFLRCLWRPLALQAWRFLSYVFATRCCLLLLLLLLPLLAVGGFYPVTGETLLCGAGSFFSTAFTQLSTHVHVAFSLPTVLALLLLARRFFPKAGTDNGRTF
jgi:hypothetical protein